jgi:WD40-like Beta Propeller Repeat
MVCLLAGPAAALALSFPVQLGAQASAGAAIPIDLAFARKTPARDNPIAVSPDGTRVAYVVQTPAEKSPRDSRYLPNGVPVSSIGNAVFVSPAAGGAGYPAAPDAGNCWRPAFAPDSRRLAFC